MAGVYRDTCAVTSALTASTTATNSTAVRDVQVATHTHTHTRRSMHAGNCHCVLAYLHSQCD